MKPNDEYVIETQALSKRYGRKLALDHLDLRVPRGRIHAIVGANGAGKSTLFRILLGFLPPTAGSARILGRDSQQLTVNPNTVSKAYAELIAEGWVESRQGLGLYVAPPRQRLSDAERSRRLDDAIQRFLHDVIALDFPPDEVQARLHREFLALAPRKSA